MEEGIYLGYGSTLQGGKYQIVKILGQGGFGITYVAYHTLLKKYCALKEFFPRDYCNREGQTSHVSVATASNHELVDKLRARFISEAQNIAALSHPSIVGVHDVFEENGTAYFVMDLIEGDSLQSLIDKQGAMDPARAVGYARKIASALEYLHARKMTHYDVKPANVMLRKSDGEPVLIDFGLSKQYDRTSGKSRSTLLVGLSPGYSPLEQYSAEGITDFSPRTDVYALGATLYALLTGKTPPEALKLMGGRVELPSRLPEHLRRAVQWAMAPGKEQRCPSALAFAQALEGGAPAPQPAPAAKKAAEQDPAKTVAIPHFDDHVRRGTYTEIARGSSRRGGGGNKKMPVWAIAAIAILCAAVAIVLCLPRGGVAAAPTQDSDTAYNVNTENPSEEAPAPAEETPAPAEEAPAPAIKEEAAAAHTDILPRGFSQWRGVFNYNGANYGFYLSLQYDEKTNTITEAYYEPEDYDGRTNLTTARINGNSIYLKGGNTEINLTLSDKWTGTMTRGNHRGKVVLTRAV